MASACIDVYVKLPSGKNAQYDLFSTDTIAILCGEIAKRENLDRNRLKIKYQGKVLKKSSALGYLGVVAETILKVEIVQPQDLTIKVLYSEETKVITISNLKTVIDLITEIEKSIDLNNKMITTKCGMRISRNGTVLDELGLVSGEELIVSEISTATNATTSDPSLSESDLDEIKTSFNAQGKKVEVAFSFDTTGSMYAYLDTVRQNLKQACSRLIADIPNIRISLIAHGDYCDQSTYVIRMVDLTSDVQELVTFAKDVPSTSGGDTPECYEWVLRKSQSLDWAEDSAKALVVIGDSPPHEMDHTDQRIDWHDDLDVLTGMGVKVYGVHAGGSVESKFFYQELADRSGGSYLPLKNFDVITDMFLAVCYNESDENHLEEFVQEIENTGEMTEAKREIFTSLKSEKKTDKPQEIDNRQMYTWWNKPRKSNRMVPPSYYYDQQKDNWSSRSLSNDVTSSVATRILSSVSPGVNTKSPKRSIRVKLCKKTCVVM
ncbi:hypothetical protein LOTGIDRAFT_232476 [Lottia gigantea]|uniref:Ubiquitin-like domain-containing protein n=1 Tax=Lottia gigantea TaxID=225164 RepID=V3ZS17_LOTGI|nr:hypothetical protein LOTGIDRAFT_232476 [Lottia gigantea]ESO94233.1 hypothetical protein LOTGIDRAFT_232476 [Lottia gigantea]